MNDEKQTELVQLAFDTDIVDWFRATGGDLEARINAALRLYVIEQKRRAGHS